MVQPESKLRRLAQAYICNMLTSDTQITLVVRQPIGCPCVRLSYTPAEPGFMDPTEVAIAVILDAGQVLLGRRDLVGPFAGCWEFAGGKCRMGETIEACFHRELAEELGITVTITRPLPVIHHHYPDLFVRLHPFLCRLRAGQPRPIVHSELRWVPIADLPNYRFPEANAPLLAYLCAALKEQG